MLTQLLLYCLNSIQFETKYSYGSFHIAFTIVQVYFLENGGRGKGRIELSGVRGRSEWGGLM